MREADGAKDGEFSTSQDAGETVVELASGDRWVWVSVAGVLVGFLLLLAMLPAMSSRAYLVNLARPAGREGVQRVNLVGSGKSTDHAKGGQFTGNMTDPCSVSLTG